MSVYLVRSDDLVKIGYSANPRRRISELQTATPQPLTVLGLTPGAKFEERRIHKHFALSRVRGEWFRFSPDMLQTTLDLLRDVKGQTVNQALKRRADCRYGLGGVRVKNLKDNQEYIIEYSSWGTDGLLLHLQKPELWFEKKNRAGGRFPVMTMQEILEGEMEPDTTTSEDSRQCVLLDDWPIPCPCWIAEDELV